jgi:hypothetical protein
MRPGDQHAEQDDADGDAERQPPAAASGRLWLGAVRGNIEITNSAIGPGSAAGSLPLLKGVSGASGALWLGCEWAAGGHTRLLSSGQVGCRADGGRSRRVEPFEVFHLGGEALA